MKFRTLLLLFVSYYIVGALGFAAGIYTLPILTAPAAPDETEIKSMSDKALFTASFRKDLKDSDFFHWGEGKVAIGAKQVTLMGKLAPGPDYKLYLSPEFVETETDFNRLKPSMVRVGDVRTFNNFIVPLPAGIDPLAYNSVIVWCESFGEFITAAQYR